MVVYSTNCDICQVNMAYVVCQLIYQLSRILSYTKEMAYIKI